jgi:hypothetical protein
VALWALGGASPGDLSDAPPSEDGTSRRSRLIVAIPAADVDQSRIRFIPHIAKAMMASGFSPVAR